MTAEVAALGCRLTARDPTHVPGPSYVSGGRDGLGITGAGYGSEVTRILRLSVSVGRPGCTRHGSPGRSYGFDHS